MKKLLKNISLASLLAIIPLGLFAEPNELDAAKLERVLARCLSTSAKDLKAKELFLNELAAVELDGKATAEVYKLLKYVKALNNLKIGVSPSLHPRSEELLPLIQKNREIDALCRRAYDILSKLGKVKCSEYLSEEGPLLEFFELKDQIIAYAANGTQLD